MRRSMMTALILTVLVALSGMVLPAAPATAAPPLADRLLVIDANRDRVLEYDAISGDFLHTLIAMAPSAATIQHIAIGPDGNVYLSIWATGSSSGSIRRYSRATGALIDTFVPNGRGGLQNPDQIVFGPDGRLYVSDRFSARILRYDAQTGAFIDTIVQDWRLGGFISFNLGPDGNIYASMFNPAGDPDPATFYNGQQCVLRYNGQTGAYIDAIYCPTAADIDGAASGLAFADGYLYVARYHAAQVVKVNLATRQVVTTLSCPGDERADDIAFGPDGALYVDNFGNENLRRIDVQSGVCQKGFFSGGAIQFTGRFVFTSATESARAQAGLLALYDFDEGSGTVVRDSSGVSYALDLAIRDPERVTWTADGLRIDQPATLLSDRTARKVNDAAKVSNEITIEAWIVPDASYGRYSGRLLTISATDKARNVTLTQGVYDLQNPNLISARIRTTSSSSGSPMLNMPFSVASPAAPRHIVYTRSADGKTRLYDNGELRVSGLASGNFSTWRRDYRLVLANELTGGRPWIGTYSLVAIYGRALSSNEVQLNYAAGSVVP
jgi:Concanavalin A-like lectin/glucanases superfamily